MLVAVIDNYDSFTFNLVHYILHTGVDAEVFRNDKISIDELKILNPDAIVISPGPGRPENAGISLDIVNRFSGIIPILGVCLGHQVIAESFGGKIIHAKQIMHGKTSMVTSDGKHIFSGCLMVTAKTEDGEIMGIRHKKHPTQGVQFHPESFMTTVGKRLIRNFIKGA